MAQNDLLDAVACQQAVVAFFGHLDERRYDDLVGLMTPDGVWLRQGVELKGPEVVRQAMEDRSPTLVIRHMLTNLHVRSLTEDEAEVSCYLTVYRHDGGTALDGPAPLDGPQTISVHSARLVRLEEGWRIARLGSRQAFTRTSGIPSSDSTGRSA